MTTESRAPRGSGASFAYGLSVEPAAETMNIPGVVKAGILESPFP